MLKQRDNYQKIVNELIEKSFPELGNWEIKVTEKDLGNFKGKIKFYPWEKCIFVDTKVRKTHPRLGIIGLLVHELCHFSIFKKNNWGWFKVNFDYLCYSLSKDYRKRVEGEVEKMILEKGYKKENKILHNIKKW